MRIRLCDEGGGSGKEEKTEDAFPTYFPMLTWVGNMSINADDKVQARKRALNATMSCCSNERLLLTTGLG